MTRSEAKTTAKALGLKWSTVEATFRELRIQQKADREFEWSVRRMCWSFYAWTEGCLEFWRHGMQRRFARAFGEGDRTLVPRFDVVAHYIAAEWPALGRDGDPSEALFELIAKPHNALPSVEETWDEAIQLAETGDVSFDVSLCSSEPF